MCTACLQTMSLSHTLVLRTMPDLYVMICSTPLIFLRSGNTERTYHMYCTYNVMLYWVGFTSSCVAYF